METQIKELRFELILPLVHPELFQSRARSPARGFLLYGAPGVGKSILVRAFSCEYLIPMISVAGSDLRSSLAGKTEKNLAQLFNMARAVSMPIFLFFDEIDALLSGRETHGVNSFYSMEANELLQQMQGLVRESNVRVLGATNLPWKLDRAGNSFSIRFPFFL